MNLHTLRVVSGLRVRAIVLRSTVCFRLLLALVLLSPDYFAVSHQRETAAIRIDASKVEGTISPTLYGQFIEFMFEGIKGGLYAELIRNRSFEQPTTAIGLSQYWERYPDDRNDDYGLSFAWDGSASYPAKESSAANTVAHSLRMDVGDGVVQPHGIYQGSIPVRHGLEYRGYFWAKTLDFSGTITAALEADITAGYRCPAIPIGRDL